MTNIVEAGQTAQQSSNEATPSPKPFSTALKFMVGAGVAIAAGITARHLVDGQIALAATTALMGLPAATYCAYMNFANHQHEKKALPNLADAVNQRRDANAPDAPQQTQNNGFGR